MEVAALERRRRLAGLKGVAEAAGAADASAADARKADLDNVVEKKEDEDEEDMEDEENENENENEKEKENENENEDMEEKEQKDVTATITPTLSSDPTPTQNPMPMPTVEIEAQRLIEASKRQREETAEQQLSLADLAPKKANWDLKRDLEGKTAELEGQTQAAITRLIRQRLEAQKN